MNTQDLLDQAKYSLEQDRKIFMRAITLLQSVYIETDRNREVSTKTLAKIEKVLDDNYQLALKE